MLILRYVKNYDVFKLLVKKRYIEHTKFMKRGQRRTDSLNKKVKIEKVCAVSKRLLKCRVWPLKVWNIILLFCSSDFCLLGSECYRCSFLSGASRFQLTSKRSKPPPRHQGNAPSKSFPVSKSFLHNFICRLPHCKLSFEPIFSKCLLDFRIFISNSRKDWIFSCFIVCKKNFIRPPFCIYPNEITINNKFSTFAERVVFVLFIEQHQDCNLRIKEKLGVTI